MDKSISILAVIVATTAILWGVSRNGYQDSRESGNPGDGVLVHQRRTDTSSVVSVQRNDSGDVVRNSGCNCGKTAPVPTAEISSKSVQSTGNAVSSQVSLPHEQTSKAPSVAVTVPVTSQESNPDSYSGPAKQTFPAPILPATNPAQESTAKSVFPSSQSVHWVILIDSKQIAAGFDEVGWSNEIGNQVGRYGYLFYRYVDGDAKITQLGWDKEISGQSKPLLLFVGPKKDILAAFPVEKPADIMPLVWKLANK